MEHQNVFALEGGRARKQSITDVTVPDSDIIRHVPPIPSMSPAQAMQDAESALAIHATKLFEGKNIAVKMAAETEITHIQNEVTKAEEISELAKIGLRKLTGVLHVKTPAKHDPKYRLSFGERIEHGFYIITRFAFPVVSVTAMALMARASGFSVDISSSWPIALIYTSVVYLVSGMLGSRGDLTNYLEVRRGLTRRYMIIATTFFFVWLAAASVFFAPAESATAYAVNFSTESSAAAFTFLGFTPKTVIGVIMAFAHIVSDVYGAATLAMVQKLAGLKGRDPLPMEAPEAVTHREIAEAQQKRTEGLVRRLGELQGLLNEWDSKRASTVSDANARLRYETRRRETDAQIAAFHGLQVTLSGASAR